MKLTRTVMVFVGLLFLCGVLVLCGVLAATASATPVIACQLRHLALQNDTYKARPSFTNEQDWLGSIEKLRSVWPRLADVKHPFVEEDLTAFQGNLNELATATQAKIDPTVAQRLSAQAQEVIDCANSLDAP